ncbi:putative adenylosuccinate synthetase [Trypanosoma rangeli]|uniref:Adenylosuccinate synthetase n=1 Tax=Trypanosoma rangeli TaxID=5698 RepID=A0A422NLD0_TRYRA|nr:putative adenylosuccinate synthetase [Trypanosoma rangeli]RNF06265.1 putative adenylosuccinate synthetase [Trypanosoma rangeli]|eukprot:RNF06265.1 putative adenylosuccinate synthetase [Trypanosoma rangeli]
MTGGDISLDKAAPQAEGSQNGKSLKTLQKKGSSTNKHTYRTNSAQRAVYDYLKKLKPIPELAEPKSIGIYEEASMETVLYPLIEKHQVIMVAGAFFGDEGKGKTVDAVARHPACTCIARVNSGENAGHTVYDDAGRRFVFNLAPSGLLSENKRNYVGPECVMDPISFMEKEVGQLIEANVPYKDRLFIGNVNVVTPYHKLLDVLASAPNSSTLKGMAPAHASKVTKRGIRLDHIFNDPAVLSARLAKDMDTYFGFLKVKALSDADVVQRCEEENSDGVMRVPSHVMEFARAEDKVGYLVKLYMDRVKNNKEFPLRCDVAHELRSALERGEKIMLEGPQSYWLSNAHEKFWESTTSADTTAAGLLATAQFNFQRYRSVVINVHKAPASSRVGIGANPSSFISQDFFSAQGVKTLHDLPENMCVDFDGIQKLFFTKAFHLESKEYNGIWEPLEFEDSSGKYNIGVAMAIASSRHHEECGAVTKKPRVCGLFDCVLHFEVNAVQGPYLSISALDRGDDYEKIGVTIAYVYYNKDNHVLNLNGREYKNGDIIKAGEAVPSEAVLYYCHPIVKLVNGWRQTPIAASKRKVGEPLPRGVCEFIATVEHFTKAKVISVGNGPRGSDIIYLKQ